MEVYFIIPLSRRRCLVMLVISLSTSNTPDPGATMITVWPVRPKLRSMWCLSKAETKNGENKMRNYQPGIETERNQGLHWVHSTFLCDWSNDLKKTCTSLSTNKMENGHQSLLVIHIFPRFRKFSCSYFEFSSAPDHYYFPSAVLIRSFYYFGFVCETLDRNASCGCR